MTKDNKEKSDCCNAPVKVEGKTTRYYVCSKCNKACDIQVDKEKEIDKDCPCQHTMYYSITIGDSCLHIIPHPTRKQYNKYIKPRLLDLLEQSKKKGFFQ